MKDRLKLLIEKSEYRAIWTGVKGWELLERRRFRKEGDWMEPESPLECRVETDQEEERMAHPA